MLSHSRVLNSFLLLAILALISIAGSLTATAASGNGSVVSRLIFYNHSAWDGNNPVANASDDLAIATDKVALLRGQTATFTNYTSFNKGINGIMVDLVPSGIPTAGDFTFKVGNDNSPENWATAPAPTNITVRAGAGVSGTDRVTIIWSNNAIQKQWLEVRVLATANTGLGSPDILFRQRHWRDGQ